MLTRYYTMLMIAFLTIPVTGCQRIDSKVDIPEGRDSENQRYEDGDIVGPVLKLKLKEVPPSPTEQRQDPLVTEDLIDTVEEEKSNR
ncbi:MAG: hypothetical protein HY586_03700 [Candidatus Omnitrophica bacterium]|nr:hypothetical protein [Candidatus Omnitrophota bacterium]